jgi:hypothetical protein
MAIWFSAAFMKHFDTFFRFFFGLITTEPSTSIPLAGSHRSQTVAACFAMDINIINT